MKEQKDDLIKDENGNVILPQPEDISQQNKRRAADCYFIMLAGMYLPIPFIEIIMSILYYNYFKAKSRFVAFHSYQSMISQIGISLLGFGIIILIVIFGVIIAVSSGVKAIAISFGILIFITSTALVVINIIYIVLSIIGYSKANKGQFYYMPFFGRNVFEKFYGPDAIELPADGKEYVSRNQPPE